MFFFIVDEKTTARTKNDMDISDKKEHIVEVHTLSTLIWKTLEQQHSHDNM